MELNLLKPLNTVSTIELEVISPLHVGAAAEKLWTENIDFFYDGEAQQVVVIDQQKLVHALVHAYTESNERALMAYQKRLASGRNWNLRDFLEECDIDPLEVQKLSRALLVAPAGEIRPLIRTGMDTPIIPGSSIKGALRSVIFHHLQEKVKPQGDDPERVLFGSIDQDIMKYIRPYDAECRETSIINCDLFNLYQEYGNWESDYKDNFPLTVEAFMPGARSTFRLAVADGLLHTLEQAGKAIGRYVTPRYIREAVVHENPVRHLFHLVNVYTRIHLERELAFFLQYPQAEDIEFLMDNLRAYVKMTQEEDSCLLRLAYGSGFHGITGDWRFPDHTTTIRNPDQKNRTWNAATRSREPARYKSRKVVGRDEKTTLMGFVQLKIQ